MAFERKHSKEFEIATVNNALEHVANGLSLTSFCDANKLLYATVVRWIEEQKAVDRLTRARVIGTHALADQSLDELRAANNKTANLVKIRTEGYLKLAKVWNRAEFGDQPVVAIQNNLSLDFSGLSDSAYAELKAKVLPQLPAPNGSGE